MASTNQGGSHSQLISIHQTDCICKALFKQDVALTGRNTTGPPCSVIMDTGGGITSSPGLHGWSRLQARRGVLQTTDDDRH